MSDARAIARMSPRMLSGYARSVQSVTASPVVENYIARAFRIRLPRNIVHRVNVPITAASSLSRNFVQSFPKLFNLKNRSTLKHRIAQRLFYLRNVSLGRRIRWIDYRLIENVPYKVQVRSIPRYWYLSFFNRHKTNLDPIISWVFYTRTIRSPSGIYF